MSGGKYQEWTESNVEFDFIGNGLHRDPPGQQAVYISDEACGAGAGAGPVIYREQLAREE